MDLDETIRRIFLVHRKLILVCVVLGMIGGLALTAVPPNEYTAAARLTLGGQDAGTSENAVSAADGAEAIVTSRAIVEAALQVVGRDLDPVKVAKESISVKTLGSSDVVQLEVTDVRPDVASALANAIAQELVDKWGDMSGGQSAGALIPLRDEIGQIRDEVAAADERIALLDIQIARGRPADVQKVEAQRDALNRQREGLEVQRLLLESQLNRLLVDGASWSAPEVIDPAVPPARPDAKHKLSTAALGAFLGFLFGICLVALVESVRPTVVRPEAIADVLGVPMLGKMRADANGSPAEVRVSALKARLAATGVNAKAVELVTVGPPIALSRLAEAMERFNPATDEPGRPHVTGVSGHLTVRRFGIDPAAATRSSGSEENSQSALVAVLPSKVKRSDLIELIELQEMTSWPLVGVVTFDPSSRAWPRVARRRNAGAGKLRLSQRSVRSHKTPLRPVRRVASLGWRRADRLAFTIVVGLAVTVTVIAVNFVRDEGRRVAGEALGRRAPVSVATQPSLAVRTRLASSLPGVKMHVNEQIGYLFSYPDDWELSSAGAVDELTDPNGDVVMSFDAAPAGSLRHASEQVVAGLSARYSDLHVVLDRFETPERGQPSSVLGATAVDKQGGLIRLMVIMLRGPGQNRAITARFSPGSDPLRALPDVQQIVGSFRTSVEL